MPELRWTLLVLGVVFIVALALWERRRPRHASRAEHEMHREPTLTLPEVRARDTTVTRDLPVVTVTDESWESLHADRSSRGGLDPAIIDAVTEPRRESFASSADVDAQIAAVADEVAGSERVDEHAREVAASFSEPAVAASAEPFVFDDPPFGSDDGVSDEKEPYFEFPDSPAETADASEQEEAAGRDSIQTRDHSETAEVLAAGETVEQPVLDIRAALPDVVEPIVDWPPDDVRKVVALRLVASGSGRLAGRAIRQALLAEGFVLGKFEIFHKPGADNRALLSAASLTKPGTFDPDTMDTRHYNGLSLFAVLPGPKKPPQAFEDLLHTARNLNERLQGALQDERGGPLTPMRIDTLRSSMGVGADT